jgi:hypothetical protein
MISPAEALRVPLRAGLHNIVRFNLAVALVGALTAFAWNPDAAADDLVVVICLPPILLYTLSRVWGAFRKPAAARPTQPQAEQTPRQLEIQQAAPLATHQLEATRQRLLSTARRLALMVRLLLLSLILWGNALGILLALPIYALVGIRWAITYGLAMAALLFVTAVLMFALGIGLAPSVWPAIRKVVGPAIGRLLPSAISAKDPVSRPHSPIR